MEVEPTAGDGVVEEKGNAERKGGIEIGRRTRGAAGVETEVGVAAAGIGVDPPWTVVAVVLEVSGSVAVGSPSLFMRPPVTKN